MDILFDTSFFVALFEKGHPVHKSTRQTYQYLKGQKANFYVASHTLAELYAVLTALPVQPRITTRQARQLIEENIIDRMQVIEISFSMYRDTIQRLSENYQSGGIIYDALIVEAARKQGVDCLYTLNKSDFHQVWDEEKSDIRTP